jgi:NADH-quinone oxidoreductase subunit M
MQFPFLSVIIFTPLTVAVLLLLMPANRKDEVRVLSAFGAFVTLALSVFVFIAYDKGGPQYQFVEKVPWVPALGISYHVATDGISNAMLVLTGLVIFTGTLVSWGIQDRTREFYALVLMLVSGVFGVFVSRDAFLLFFFYELVIFPIYILIATWGSIRKEYAAMKLTLYLLIGSIVALVGVLAIYFSFSAPERTFDLDKLTAFAQQGALMFNVNLPMFGLVNFETLWFLPVFVGFSVLASIWPFHNWSPDGYAAAPTVVSMLHAGVLKNVGAFAALRMGIELMPHAARQLLPFVIFLVTVNVLYAAAIALVQKDFKYVIGFSSVSHMGLVLMGFTTMNAAGLNGSVMQMFSHGSMTALFFAVVGMIYDRAHTRDIPSLGGFAKKMPWVAVAFIIGGLSGMGMPGLPGFVAELQVFMGVWKAGQAGIAAWYPYIAAITVLGVILTAAYVLRVITQVFFGEFHEEKFHGVGDVTVLDKAVLVILTVVLITVGVFPQLMMNMISTGTAPLVQMLARVAGGG